MKYIAHQNNHIVIFDDGQLHADVADKMRWTKEKITGAGFVYGLGQGDREKVKTEGESVSLGIRSNPDDADIIKRDIWGY